MENKPSQDFNSSNWGSDFNQEDNDQNPAFAEECQFDYKKFTANDINSPKESFTWKKFRNDMLYKFTSRCFWIWLVSTYFIWQELQKNGDSAFPWIAWMVFTFLYYGGDVIKQAISVMISKAQMSLGLNAGVSANINKGEPDPFGGGFNQWGGGGNQW